jgi:hypothetical protein
MLAQYKQTDQDFIINRFRYKNIVSLACNLWDIHRPEFPVWGAVA